MREKLTADDILTATKAMEEKKANWEANHPDEKMPVCPRCGNTGLRPRWYDDIGNELETWQVGAYEYLYPCGCITLDKRITLRNNRKFYHSFFTVVHSSLDCFSDRVAIKVQHRYEAVLAFLSTDLIEKLAAFFTIIGKSMKGKPLEFRLMGEFSLF